MGAARRGTRVGQRRRVWRCVQVQPAPRRESRAGHAMHAGAPARARTRDSLSYTWMTGSISLFSYTGSLACAHRCTVTLRATGAGCTRKPAAGLVTLSGADRAEQV